MGTKRLRARLVTSQPIAAYGGIQLAESVVEQIADGVGSGAIPMHMKHDIAQPLATTIHGAGTERLPDGHLAAWAEFDVDEDAWSEFEAEIEAAGAPGGMSITISGPLVNGESMPDSPVTVAADAHHFTESEIRAAAEELRQLDDSAEGEYLYQFAFEPLATVVFDLVLPVIGVLGPNLVASAIYDAGKAFFLRPRPNGVTFNVIFRESRRGDRKLQIKIAATNAAEFDQALSRLPAVIESGAKGTYTSVNGGDLVPLDPGPQASTEQPADDGQQPV